MHKQLKIVLTGAESTGKSTLGKQLASHYNALFVPELSREYIEKLNSKYTYNDICNIAEQQIQFEKEISPAQSLVIFDTWLIITKVWFDFVYQKHPSWLNTAIEQANIDLFLLCDIDIPWEFDPVRENGGENRVKLHNIYINELEAYGFNYEIISGKSNQRLKTAINTIDKYEIRNRQ